ncbi:MAG: hypothetical protein QM723_05135 [Myxococcaceae bacterium]
MLALGCGPSSYPVAETNGGAPMNGGTGSDAGHLDAGVTDGGFGGGTPFDGGTFVDGGIAASPGMLLIETNEGSGNAIIAFRRGADGTLTELPQGRVMTGGDGIAPDVTQRRGPFEADQQLVLTPDHR